MERRTDIMIHRKSYNDLKIMLSKHFKVGVIEILKSLLHDTETEMTETNTQYQ